MSTKCRVLKSGMCEITQGFGGSNNHRGLDIVDQGYTIGDVVAYDNGTVQMAVTGYGNGSGEGVNWRYGNFVKLLHDNGTVTLYAHLEYTNLKVGQRVNRGDFIGRMGNSGNSNGGHLHWEYWSRNDYYSNIDPTPYLYPVEITVPEPIEQNEKVNQVRVVCGRDTLRVRKSPDLGNNFIGFAIPGFYNIISTYEDGTYNWFQVEEGKWFAGVEGCVVYYPLIEEKEEEPTIIPTEPEPSENEPENTENEPIIEPINQDKKNPLIEFIKWIIKLINKIFNKKD